MARLKADLAGCEHIGDVIDAIDDITRNSRGGTSEDIAPLIYAVRFHSI